MGPNRVYFECRFHGKPAHGTLTFDDDGRFTCAFRVDGNVVWPFSGRWRRAYGPAIFLTTPHGYCWVTLEEQPDQTLVGVASGGGFADFDIRGARSSVLRRPLPNVREAANA
jgi:hypothetical protein